MSRTAEAPSALGWDLGEPEGNWDTRSTAVLLAISSCYWLSTWLAAGLPPLTALACRGARRPRLAPRSTPPNFAHAVSRPPEEAFTHPV